MKAQEATVVSIGLFATHGARTGERKGFSNSVPMVPFLKKHLMGLVTLINMEPGLLTSPTKNDLLLF